MTTQLPPLFVTVNEAKRLLCVGHSRIYQMLAAGDIERVKNGGKTLIPYKSITDFAESLRGAAQ